MVITPWGDSAALRDQMLPPGPANTPQAVAENQRRRLFGAMVASVAERGYWNTRVSDLTEISGVSLRSFYDLFADKDSCFLATVTALIDSTVELVVSAPREENWEHDLRQRLATLAELAAAQSAGAKLCLVESYVGGAEPAKLLAASEVRAEALIRERFESSSRWADLPPEMPTVAVAAFVETFRSRLVKAQSEVLPQVADEIATFLLSYEPPTRPLRSAARPPKVRPEEEEASDHAERALRAFEALLSQQPYAETTMEQVAKRATMSVRTLYANFSSREELMASAVDSAGALVAASVLPAFRRASSPPDGIRAALGAMFGLLSSRPNMANLLLQGAYEGGAPALLRRSEALWPLELLLIRAAPARLPVARKVVSGAILGGLLGLARQRLAEAGAGALTGLTQISTFIALAPLLGAESATAAAEGKSYRRLPPTSAGARLAVVTPIPPRLLLALSQGPMSVEQIAAEAELTPAEAELALSALDENPLSELTVTEGDDGVRRYQSRWPVFTTEQVSAMSPEEERRISQEGWERMQRSVEEAIAAGTFESRPERFLVQLPVWLDEQGWLELSDCLTGTMDECWEIQERARQRLEEGGRQDEAFGSNIFLATFEMPAGGLYSHH